MNNERQVPQGTGNPGRPSTSIARMSGMVKIQEQRKEKPVGNVAKQVSNLAQEERDKLSKITLTQENINEWGRE